MKTKLPLIAALYCGLCTVSSAFTLDFNGYVGKSLPTDTISILIEGYGNVTFTAGNKSTLIVDEKFKNDNGFGAPSLSFDEGDTVNVTFEGAQPLNVDFDYVGVSDGESFTTEESQFASQTFTISLEGNGDGAGLYQISWNQVPEPSSALLGLLGSALLVIRRRR
ncbi:PEP-CTERM sorting domain-containing protein [Luteolibacter algae]|uniref:PEP-CTERM sorting domain-containing protein n=1 Tax=Luteolibacter algae TaxID=454151 RepID=A0ABW5DB80_9BACT